MPADAKPSLFDAAHRAAADDAAAGRRRARWARIVAALVARDAGARAPRTGWISPVILPSSG